MDFSRRLLIRQTRELFPPRVDRGAAGQGQAGFAGHLRPGKRGGKVNQDAAGGGEHGLRVWSAARTVPPLSFFTRASFTCAAPARPGIAVHGL